MSSPSKAANIFCLTLFILMVTISLTLLSSSYSDAQKENKVNGFSEARFFDFYALPQNSLDMVFVGSSHSYCSFDPENFDATLGISSFQLGMPLQLPDATFYTLTKMYETQNPKVIIMEVYWQLLEVDFEEKQAVQLFASMKDEKLEQSYFREVYPIANKITGKFGLFTFRQDYFEYRSKKINDWLERKFSVSNPVKTQDGTEYYKGKGYVYCDYKMLPGEFSETNQFSGYDAKNFRIHPNQQKYLEKIIALCEEKGSQLVFVTAPVACVSLDLIKNYYAANSEINRFSSNYQIPYFDYNLPSQRLELTNFHFRDDAHLNDAGVKMLNSDFLEKLLALNYFPMQ